VEGVSERVDEAIKKLTNNPDLPGLHVERVLRN